MTCSVNYFFIAKATGQMVIHHPHRLHKGITDGGAAKAEAALLHVFADGIGKPCAGWNMLQVFPFVVNGLVIGKAPDIAVEAAEFLLHLQERFCIFHRRLNLHLVPDDAGILHQRAELFGIVPRDFLRIEVVECLSEVFALVHDGAPAQSRLKSIEHDGFKQLAVIMTRASPLTVMVGEHQRVILGPRTANRLHWKKSRFIHAASCCASFFEFLKITFVTTYPGGECRPRDILLPQAQIRKNGKTSEGSSGQRFSRAHRHRFLSLFAAPKQ